MKTIMPRVPLLARGSRQMSTGPVRTVVALGGNALVRKGDDGSAAQQLACVRTVAKQLAAFPKGTELVVSHGNGPQVGQILLQSDLTADKFPATPIDSAVAATQGQIGIMMQHSLAEALGRPAVTVCTTVLVSESDPDFQDPTKYVGSFYDEAGAKKQEAELGWKMKEDKGRGWRRVVPSPKPSGIVETESVRTLLEAGVVTIACGGGSVPAVQQPGGGFKTVEAVVDKDLSSMVLARELGAKRLIILTAVDEVQCDYGTPEAEVLYNPTVEELQRKAARGQFPPGSMGPKIEAALAFLEGNPGAECLITSPEAFGEALSGKKGTWIRS